MTAARRPRSAALLVGSTSATSANVQSAGQLEQVLGERAHVPLPLAGRAPLEQRPHLCLDLLDAPPQGGAVAVLLELLPGVEGATRSSAVCLLKAPQSVRGSPLRYQPVSSMLSAPAVRVCPSSPSYTGTNVSPVRVRIASTVPTAIGQP